MAQTREHTESLGNGWMLSIRTYKNDTRGCVASYATVNKVEDTGTGFVSTIHRVFHDFCGTVALGEGRATAANVSRVHDQALARLPEIKEALIAHYEKIEPAVIEQFTELNAVEPA